MSSKIGYGLGRIFTRFRSPSFFKCAILAVAVSLTTDLQAAVFRGMSGGGHGAIGVRGGMVSNRGAMNRAVAFHRHNSRFVHSRFANQRFFDHRRMFAHRRFLNNSSVFVGASSFAYGYPSGYGYGQPYYDAPVDYSDDTSNTYWGESSAGLGESVRDVQLKLARLGYYQGSIDGIAGPLTREAVKAYQHDYNLSVTGTITSGMLAQLNSQ